jgi:Tol biopolymer transport system component
MNITGGRNSGCQFIQDLPWRFGELIDKETDDTGEEMRQKFFIILSITLMLCGCTKVFDLFPDLEEEIATSTPIENETQKTETLDISEGNENANQTKIPSTKSAPPQETIIVAQPRIFPEVKLLLLGYQTNGPSDIYQINLPCWDDSFQCDIELVNIFDRNELNAWDFEISPDGTRMVFLSDYLTNSGNADIFLYNFENRSLTRLTQTSVYEYMLSWAPSGELIAYTVNDGRSRWIEVISDGGNLQMTIPTTHKRTFSPIVSNNGKMIAYYANDGVDTADYLYYYDYETQQNVQLPVSDLSTVYDVVWSPDDSSIAYIADHSGAPDICIVEIRSMEDYCLTDTNQWEYHPSWSPDGERIAYSVLDQPGGHSAIWSMNNDGTDKILVSQEDSLYFWPMWIFDSNFILCDKNINGVWQPVIVSVEDDTEIRLVVTTFNISRQWIGQD